MELGIGVAGAKCGDVHPGPLRLQPQALRRLDQETLDRAVQGVAAGRRHLPRQRGHVQHPTPAARDHAGQQQARQLDRRGQHDPDHGGVVGRICGQETRGAAEARVVDQTVDAQAPRRDRLDQSGGRPRLGQIGGDDAGDDAISRRQVFGQGRQRPLAPGGQDQVVSARGALTRQGRADAGAGPRDQDGASRLPQATRVRQRRRDRRRAAQRRAATPGPLPAGRQW